MKSDYYLKYFTLISSLLLLSFSITAQNNTTLTGKILDHATRLPLAGATVHIKGTTHEVLTDNTGEFKFITAQKAPLVYVVTFVGYQTEEVPLNVASEIQIELKEVNALLNEVLVVGYGTQTRKSLIGSVTKVDPSQTKEIPGGGFDVQLQGKTAGVQINSNTGTPGQDAYIRVRGATSIYASNDPLYIIDGVFVNTGSLQQTQAISPSQIRTPSPMADINPSDIESIEILKDASAVAIYGSRGANGVVIVTTKKGKYGQKPVVEFSASEGASWVPKNREWKQPPGLSMQCL